MAFNRRCTWDCRLCSYAFESTEEFVDHLVRSEKHKMSVFNEAPYQIKNILRLQNLLNTYLKAEPALGLECIGEELLDSGSYGYTCQLCDFQGDIYHTVMHIIGETHMATYINKYHSVLTVSEDGFWKREEYLNALRWRAFKIQKRYGRQSIKIAEPEGAAAAPEVKRFYPALARKKLTCFHEGKDLKRSMRCALCRVTCASLTLLHSHVMGGKHRDKLEETSPMTLKSLSKLQYFMDTHMKDLPLLGMEYVVEEHLPCTTTLHTCQLCDEQGDLLAILLHITHVKHVVAFLEKHHPEELPDPENYKDREVYIRALTAVAIKTHEEYGRKKSMVKMSGITFSARVRVRDMTTEFHSKPPFSIDNKEWRECRSCGSFYCSVVDFAYHFMGNKHWRMLKLTKPELRNEMVRLHYFVENCAKNEPMLGLQYILEEQVDAISFKYSCQMCDVAGELMHIVTHLLSVAHIENYINRHHSRFRVRDEFSSRYTYSRTLRGVAEKIATKYGRKAIQVKPFDGAVQTKVATKVTAVDIDDKTDPQYSFLVDVRTEHVCVLCGVINDSFIEMTSHYMDIRHRINVRLTEPELLRELGNLKLFIDTLAKNDPLLGLEYIVQERLDYKTFRYACQLCDVEGDFLEITKHIICYSHLALYIRRHHPEMSSRISLKNIGYVRSLMLTCYELYEKYGRKDIQLTITDGNEPAPPKIHVFEDGNKKQQMKPQYCQVCEVKFCTLETLYDHFMGADHILKLEVTEPEKVTELANISLERFLGAFVKEESILGLEYFVEEQLDSSYKYTCQLCDVEGDLRSTLAHITDVEHKLHYVEKHYKEFIPILKNTQKVAFLNNLNRISWRILNEHGSKSVIKKNNIDCATEMAKLSLEDRRPESDPLLDSDPVANRPESDPVANPQESDPVPDKPESSPLPSQRESDTDTLSDRPEEEKPMHDRPESDPVANPQESGPVPDQPESSPLPSQTESHPMPDRPEESDPVPDRPEESDPVPDRPEESDPVPDRPEESDPVPDRAEESGPVPDRAEESGPVPDRAEESGPVPDRAEESGPVPDRAEESGPVPDRAEESGPVPDRAEESGPVPDRAEESGPVPDWAEESGPVPDWAEESGPVPDRAEESGPVPDRAEESGPVPDRAEESGPVPDRAEESDPVPDRAEESDPVPDRPEGGDPVPDRPEESECDPIPDKPDSSPLPFQKDSDTLPDRPEESDPVPNRPESDPISDNPDSSPLLSQRASDPVPDRPEESAPMPDKPEGDSMPDKPDSSPLPSQRENGTLPDRPEDDKPMCDRPESAPMPDKPEGDSMPDKPDSSPLPSESKSGTLPDRPEEDKPMRDRPEHEVSAI